MKDILPQITEELAAGEFTVEGSWKGPESLKETALGVIRDRLMQRTVSILDDEESLTKSAPADVVDYPNQLIKKMLVEEERNGLADLYKRLHERTKSS